MTKTFAEQAGFLPPHDPKLLAEFYARKASDSPRLPRKIECLAELVVMHHFQLWTETNVQSTVAKALSFAEEYFCNLNATTKWEDGWFAPLSNTYLLGTYVGDWESLKTISASIEIDREPDYVGGIEPEVQTLYLVIAQHLGGNADPIPSEIYSRIESTKRRRPRFYRDIWRAIEGGDVKGFQYALVKSLRNFASRKKPPLDATYGLEWVARTESILANIGVRSAMQLPDLEQASRAVLMVKGDG